jgi:hypothetical protein
VFFISGIGKQTPNHRKGWHMAADNKIERVEKRIKRLKERLTNIDAEKEFIAHIVSVGGERLGEFIEDATTEAKKKDSDGELSQWELAIYLAHNSRAAKWLPEKIKIHGIEIPVRLVSIWILALLWLGVLEAYDDGDIENWDDKAAQRHEEHLKRRLARDEKLLAKLKK